MPNTYFYDGTKLIVKDEQGNIIATPAIGANGIPIGRLDAFIAEQGLVPETPKELPTVEPIPESPDIVQEAPPVTKIEKPGMVVVNPPPQVEPEKPSMWQNFVSGIKQAFTPRELPEKKIEEPKVKPKKTEREIKSEKQFKKTMGTEYDQLKKLEEYLKQSE